MALTKMGLYELLAPQFLAGYTFPPRVDAVLSILLVEELHTAYDDWAIVYTGSLSLDPSVVPVCRYEDPLTGAVFSWDDHLMEFRLTIPRWGSQPLAAVFAQLNNIGTMGGVPAAGAALAALGVVWPAGGAIVQADLDTMVNMAALLGTNLGPGPAPNAPPPLPPLPPSPNVSQQRAAATDFPDVAFRLELLLSSLTFELGPEWKPAKVEDSRFVRDSGRANERVRFVLPKVALVCQQMSAGAGTLGFRLKSWGSGGFDAPTDMAAGELVRMEPPLTIHESGRVGFGIDQIILDLSVTSTPPEILKHFGTDEEWTGLYLKNLQFFYTDESKEFAFNARVSDALISFSGEVSFEAAVDILGEEFSFDVLFYDGADNIAYFKGQQGNTEIEAAGKQGRVIFPPDGTIQVLINGGAPPFTVSVLQQPGDIELWDDNARVAKFKNPSEPLWLLVSVADSAGHKKFEKIEVVLFKRTKQLPGAVAQLAQAEWKDEQVIPAGASGYDVEFTPAARGVTETLRVSAPNRQAEVTLKNQNGDVRSTFPLTGKLFTVDVGADDEVGVEIHFAAEPASVEFFDLWYKYERPPQGQVEAVKPFYVTNFPPGTPDKEVDERFLESTLPATAGGGADPYEPNGADALRAWLDKRVPVVNNKKTVTLHGYSSYESDPNKFQYNWDLSKRRLQVTRAIVESYVPPPGVTVEIVEAPEIVPTLLEDKSATPQEKNAELDNLGAPRGHSYARVNKALHGDEPTHADFPTPYPPAKQQSPNAPLRHGNKDDRVVTVSAALGGHDEVTVKGRLTRGPSSAPVPPEPPKPPAPPPPLNEPPPVFQRIGLRVRVERNLVVLAEVSGRLDFETQLEQGLRNGVQNSVQQSGNSNPLPSPDQKLLTSSNDGVLDFAITVTYDTSTKYVTETLWLSSGAGDQDGIYQPDVTDTTAGNILGAMLTFMPIIGETVPDTLSADATDWALMAVAWAFPVAVGVPGFFETTKLTLYGGELRFRQHVPQTGNVQFTDAAIIFDYGVEFELHIDPLNIHSTKPLRVRYRAVGFNLHFDTGPNDELRYQPIFDPSKGYELDLSDPALFGVTGLLGDLFRVLGVRIARFNPFTLELDLGLKVDLGLVTVDTFKVKWPLDPLGTPMILPSGVHVNLEKTITGSGYVNITDTGFMGTIDLTIVPLKIRVAASLAVVKIEDEVTGRTETGVYFGLTVEFPTPIILGATGLGIYGFSGLFAMHYMRTEGERTPQDSIGPALAWLKKAGGEPARLVNPDTLEVLWKPELDRWGFGLGVVLGTLEGGFLANLRGMLLLELPGPRILVFVKMQVITNLPSLGDADVDMGLLGVLDLDFNLKRITIGVIIDFKYRKDEPGKEGGDLLQLRIPIELFFDWKVSADNWHLHIGTIEAPASMNILGIVKGTGYFMISGKDIPSPAGVLGGIAIAAGIYAPMIWGWESIGLYAKVYVKADVGFSLSPLAFVGNLTVGGELRLFIIGIEVHASLTVSAPPVYFKGELCGSVDFFFFEIEGCVDITFGLKPSVIPAAPSLVTNCWIQSFAPVIASGQGGDRPIDASLGDAATASDGDLPVVPIDAIPVLQLVAPPQVTAATTSYTESLKLAPGYVDVDGWSEVGGDVRSHYVLKSVELFVGDFDDPADFGGDLPPAVWRREPVEAANGQKTNLDLALGSRTPVTAPYALERSTELKTIVTEQWEGICDPAAPPACVLWTFCNVPLGASGKGWTLTGVPFPDPPGTTRDVPPPTQLFVEEPALDELEVAANQLAELYGDPYLIPARVLGILPAGGGLRQIEQVKCLRALHLPKLWRGVYQGPTVNKPPAYVEAQNKLKKSQWITLKTGAASAVRLFLALEPRFLKVGVCRLRQLRKNGQVISDEPLLSLPHKEIKQPADFPPKWTDAASPWQAGVQQVSTFLGGGKFSALKKLLFDLRPKEGCVALQIYVVPELFNLELTVLVGAVEVCSLAEKARYEYETSVKKEETETILDFLEPSGEPAPLLLPDKRYRIKVAYESRVQVKGKDDKGHYNGQMEESAPLPLYQEFYFRTDKRAPNRLDPWVLGTTPHQGEQYHFYKEPIKVVFNDESAVPLFAAYNVKLTFSIRGADGEPVLPEPPKEPSENLVGQVVGFGLDGYLDVKDSDFNSPYYETLSEIVEGMPCVNGSGATPQEHISVINADLAPLMNYTFDIEPAKLDPDKEMELMPFLDKDGNELPVKGQVPFFRRSFKTSRYESMEQFAGEVMASKILHRRLSGQLTLLPEGPTADDRIQQALLDAGEQTLPAPTENRVVIYWTAAGEDQPARQRAILIDTVEPHWRWRDEAELTPVQKSPDPNFMRVTVESKPSLVVGEKAGGASVERWVYSTGGARTLVYLDPDKLPADGPSEVTLVLKQTASEVFELAERTADFVKVVLTPKAPWEE